MLGEPAGDWIPLAAAPQLDYIGGFQIGYRLQQTAVNGNFQTAALSITGVPDGQPTQPSNTPPYCVGRNGGEGTITAVGAEIQFEGDGTYAFSVSLGDTIGTGAWGARRPRRVVHRGRPRRAAAGRRAVRVPREAAGRPPVRRHPRSRSARRLRRQTAARGRHRQRLTDRDRASASCPTDVEPPRQKGHLLPRARRLGVRQPRRRRRRQRELRAHVFGTPWSAPLRFEVHSDFRRVRATITGPRKTRPTSTSRPNSRPRPRAGRPRQARALRPLRPVGLRVQRSRGLQGEVRRQGPREVPRQPPRRTAGLLRGEASLVRRHAIRACGHGPEPDPADGHQARDHVRQAERATHAAEARRFGRFPRILGMPMRPALGPSRTSTSSSRPEEPRRSSAALRYGHPRLRAARRSQHAGEGGHELAAGGRLRLLAQPGGDQPRRPAEMVSPTMRRQTSSFTTNENASAATSCRPRSASSPGIRRRSGCGEVGLEPAQIWRRRVSASPRDPQEPGVAVQADDAHSGMVHCEPRRLDADPATVGVEQAHAGLRVDRVSHSALDRAGIPGS